MKVFFYMGRNPRNKSGVSWKIEVTGRRVTTLWGPACLRGRSVIAAGPLQSKTRTFPTDLAAVAHERKKISEKLAKGYERKPRRR